MKFVKYLVTLVIAMCAISSTSHAQTVKAVGGGSSAIFLQMGQGAASSAATSTPCVWTNGKSTNVVARDNRTSTPTDEQGNIWVTWSAGSTGTCAAPAGTGINIYSGMNLDSVVGDKCYFEVDSSTIPGCVQVLTVSTPAAGANKLSGFTDTPLPEVIRAALNGKHFTYAGTDIRPEDAKFASYRLFQSCGSPVYRNPYDLGYRLTYGLGYQTGTTGVGLQIHSAVGSGVFNVLDFNISGNDPITGQAVPSFQVDPIGAQPIVVAVAPATGSGIGAASDINGFTLSLFYEGVLARSTDLVGPTTSNPVVTLVREPLSGTYNTFEYSMPNSSQFHTSQDDNFCNGSGAVYNTTMNITSGTGVVPGAARKRAIGTGEMTAALQAASTDTLGYFFWGQANANGLTNVKYLTVNGVDPILDSYGDNGTYTAGALPQATGSGLIPPLTAVTFKNLNQGDYPIWSLVRLVSAPSDASVANLVTASHAIDATQHDYIALSNLKVWHSHFPIYPIGVTTYANGPTVDPAFPGDLCSGGSAEAGGDAGGTNISKKVNADFCSDFGNPQGLINKTN